MAGFFHRKLVRNAIGFVLAIVVVSAIGGLFGDRTYSPSTGR